MDRMETLPVRAVTPNLFSLLGVPAAIGRMLGERERDRATAVLLSHRAWQTLFDGQPDVIGKTLWIAERPYGVVGVMPERFWFQDTDAFLWTALDPAALLPDEPLTVVVRRPSNLSPPALKDTLGAGLAEYARTLPEAERGRRANVTGIGGTPIGRNVSLLFPYLLGGCVFLTWLIACANVAVLMIAQWTSREREIAVRAALGAGRGRVVRLLLTESVLVATVGGGLGVCLTFALRGLLLHNAGPSSPVALFDTSIHPSVLLESALLTVITGLLTGLAPALYETRRLLANPLRSITSDRVRQRWRHALVVAEITATVALLVVMGAMIDGYRRNLSADVGYSTHSLLVLRVDNPAGVRSAEILEFLRSLPGVTSTGAATSAPFSMGVGALRPVGLDNGDTSGFQAEFVQISPTFLPTLGVAVRAGRAFSADEAAGRGTAALVNEALANRLWPGTNPVGRRIRVENGRYDVVGVVGDYLYFPVSKVIPALFVPLPAFAADLTRVRFVIRTPVAAGALIAGLRRDIPRIGSGHVIATAFTADEIITVAGQEILAGTLPLMPLIIIGMLLTASGVYAVLAFAVARRSKEFALRVAIGASGSDLIRLVGGQSLRLIGVGSVLGVIFTFALSRIVRASGGAGSMFDTPAWPAFVAPALMVAIVGAIATWIPSRRALRTTPAVLLRVD